MVSVDAEARSCTVAPGIVLDVLNDALAPHDLTYGPQPATDYSCRRRRQAAGSRRRGRRHLDSGCCGLAGNFGLQPGHYDVRRDCTERVLLARSATLAAVAGLGVAALAAAAALANRSRSWRSVGDRV